MTIVRSEKRWVPVLYASYQYVNCRLEKKPRTWTIQQLGCAHVTVTHDLQSEDPGGSAKLTYYSSVQRDIKYPMMAIET